jgi:hypothetical protein
VEHTFELTEVLTGRTCACRFTEKIWRCSCGKFDCKKSSWNDNATRDVVEMLTHRVYALEKRLNDSSRTD